MSTHESGARRPYMVVVEGMPVFGALAADIEVNGPIESSDGPGHEAGAQTPNEAVGQLGMAVVLAQARHASFRPAAESRVIPEDGIVPLQAKPPMYSSNGFAY